MQHTWHPQSYGDIKYRISSKYGQLVSEEYPIDEMVNDDEVFKYFSKNYKQELKECCPECGSCNLLIRKTMLPKYRCNKCKYNFEVVEKILYPKLIDDREIKLECNTTNKISFRHLKKKIYDEKIKVIKLKQYCSHRERETLLEVIEQNIKYQGLEETLTYCKKCAFMYDKNSMDLCPKCKAEYKKIMYDSCNICKFGTSK